MNQLRLRMVAGPNGSGKSTLVGTLRDRIPLGIDLNPDVIEERLKATARLQMQEWSISISLSELRAFLRQHPLGGMTFSKGVSLRGTTLHMTKRLAGGYFSAVLCDFMRHKWIAQGSSFTFETVMSSPDKIEFLREARRLGYRTYLYYVCTDSPAISADRVASRVKQGGHDVPADKIARRYQRSLALLPSAILMCNRAYLFDNSGHDLRLFAEFHEHQLKRVTNDVPAWARHVIPPS